jgi:hypothetical protein
VQRELLFIYERNESTVQGLIHYKKFELMAAHLRRFIRFQNEVRQKRERARERERETERERERETEREREREM